MTQQGLEEQIDAARVFISSLFFHKKSSQLDRRNF